MRDEKIKVVIISGLSGAGKTVALRALEDSGYFCIDNLPVTLIEPFLDAIRDGGDPRKVGIGVDIREKEFLPDAYRILTSLKQHYSVEILFLEAETGVMVRRYKETRRPHPMVSAKGGMAIEEAIEEERDVLRGMRDAADRIIDTSHYSPHHLRHLVISTYGVDSSVQSFTVTLISFGYKYGVPQNLDLLFDTRFLPNPYFIPELKALKGTDGAVADFVLGQDETKEFLCHFYSLFDFLITRYLREGRSYVTVGIGCTGGRHRSPAVAEEIAAYVRDKHGIAPQITHRDMEQ